jgi:hypothetical protein
VDATDDPCLDFEGGFRISEADGQRLDLILSQVTAMYQRPQGAISDRHVPGRAFLSLTEEVCRVNHGRSGGHVVQVRQIQGRYIGNNPGQRCAIGPNNKLKLLLRPFPEHPSMPHLRRHRSNEQLLVWLLAMHLPALTTPSEGLPEALQDASNPALKQGITERLFSGCYDSVPNNFRVG